jgi:AraC-like DNA-binding protein
MMVEKNAPVIDDAYGIGDCLTSFYSDSNASERAKVRLPSENAKLVAVPGQIRLGDPDRAAKGVTSVPDTVSPQQPEQAGHVHNSWRTSLFDGVLRGVRLEASTLIWPQFRAPWGISLAAKWAVFYLVVSGKSWLEVQGLSDPVSLSEGDFVLVTGGQHHTVRDQLSTPTVDFLDLAREGGGRAGALCFGGQGPITRMVCGGMLLQNHKLNPLLAILPPLLHLKESENALRPWLRLTTEHIRSELESGKVGSREVVTRLGDILFVQALRAYLAGKIEARESGWLAAAHDPQIGRALALLHSQPQGRWTVESLARRLAMSRTSFAAKFKELVGEPPQHYFARIRMDYAAAQLRSSPDKVNAVAAAGGYQSEAAFSRSFKRHMGVSPGEYRSRRRGRPAEMAF